MWFGLQSLGWLRFLFRRPLLSPDLTLDQGELVFHAHLRDLQTIPWCFSSDVFRRGQIEALAFEAAMVDSNIVASLFKKMIDETGP